MSARTVRESFDGGSLTVDTKGGHHGRVTLRVDERAMSYAVLHLTPAEVDELIEALTAARDAVAAGSAVPA